MHDPLPVTQTEGIDVAMASLTFDLPPHSQLRKRTNAFKKTEVLEGAKEIIKEKTNLSWGVVLLLVFLFIAGVLGIAGFGIAVNTSTKNPALNATVGPDAFIEQIAADVAVLMENSGVAAGQQQGCMDADQFTGFWKSNTASSHARILQITPEGGNFEWPYLNFLDISVNSCNDIGYSLDIQIVLGSENYLRRPQFLETYPAWGYYLYRHPYQYTYNGTGAVARVERPGLGLGGLTEYTAIVYQSANSTNPGSLLWHLAGRQNQDVLAAQLTMRFEKTNKKAPIRDPFADGGLSETSSFIHQFDNYVDHLLTNYHLTSDSVGVEGYVGYKGLKDIIKGVRNNGVTNPATNIKNVRKSTRLSVSTVIEFDQHHPITAYSDIIVEGFVGEWEAFNGRRQLTNYAFYTGVENSALSDYFFPKDKYLQQLLVVFDSSALPRYNSSVHGYGTVTTTVGPIKNDMSYREFVEACIYVTQSISPLGSTHVAFFSVSPWYFDYAQRPHYETVEEANTVADFFDKRFGTPTPARDSYGSATFFYQDLPGFFGDVAFNEDFEEIGRGYGVPGYQGASVWVYEPSRNYLIDRQYLWYRADPTSLVTLPEHSAFPEYVSLVQQQNGVLHNAYVAVTNDSGLLQPGQSEGASRFEGRVGPYWSVGQTTNIFTQRPDLIENGQAGFFSPYSRVEDYARAPSVAVVNPALVQGRKIGYIDFNTFQNIDPLGLVTRTAFTGGYAATDDVHCAMIKWLNEYDFGGGNIGADSIIIDIRSNKGGFTIPHFLNCFGGDRRISAEIETGYAGEPFRSPDRMVDYEHYARSANDPTGEPISQKWNDALLQNLKPSLVEARSPGSVFKHGSVIILTSNVATSTGDFYPHQFLGENNDGNLGSIEPGSNVHMHVVGNLHGLFTGFSTQQVFSPTQSELNPLISLFGRAIPTIRVRLESNNFVATSRFFPNGTVIPGLIPVTSGVVGSTLYDVSKSHGSPFPGLEQRPLSDRLQDTVYYDFGYRGAGPDEAGAPQYADGHWDSVNNSGPTGLQTITLWDGSLFPDQPRKNFNFDLLTRRDSWLEEAIRVAQVSAYGNYITNIAQATQTAAVAAAPGPVLNDPEGLYNQEYSKELFKLVSEKRASVTDEGVLVIPGETAEESKKEHRRILDQALEKSKQS